MSKLCHSCRVDNEPQSDMLCPSCVRHELAIATNAIQNAFDSALDACERLAVLGDNAGSRVGLYDLDFFLQQARSRYDSTRSAAVRHSVVSA